MPLSSLNARPLPAASPIAPFPAMTDLDAIAEIARGNREMFEVIVRRYNQLLFRVGMAYLHDHALVEDAMQNAYVKTFLNLRKFERGAAFSTWITRIMINECLMLLRHRRSRPETPLDLLGDPTPAEATRRAGDDMANSAQRPAAAEQINAKEMKALLEQAIAALPRKYRTVYVLREIQQLSTREVSEALNVSVASVKVDLHRARERLKVELLKTSAGAELFPYPADYCDPMTARVMREVLALA